VAKHIIDVQLSTLGRFLGGEINQWSSVSLSVVKMLDGEPVGGEITIALLCKEYFPPLNECLSVYMMSVSPPYCVQNLHLAPQLQLDIRACFHFVK
jgi:hypothetical protein